MNRSILSSIKKLLGLEESYTHFDAEITMHINSVFLNLYQMGVGSLTCFSIVDKTPTWEDFFGTETPVEAVIQFVYFKVRLAFDPPTSSFVMESIQRQIAELEFRLGVECDPPVIAPIIEEE